MTPRLAVGSVIDVSHRRARSCQARLSVHGHLYTKSFSHRKSGSELLARLDAWNWIFEKRRELGIGSSHPCPPPDPRGKLTRRNKSGIVGVHRVRFQRSDKSGWCEAWVATWSPIGQKKQEKKSYSVYLYGEGEARRMAEITVQENRPA